MAVFHFLKSYHHAFARLRRILFHPHLILISLCLSLIWLVSYFRVLPVLSQTSLASLTVTASTTELNINQTSNFKVEIQPNQQLVTAIELVITYDPDIISITDINPGSFFTRQQSQIGDPTIIYKDIDTPGTIHYALGFPLGSKYSSSEAGDIAIITFQTLAIGETKIDLITEGNPRTLVSGDNTENILGTTHSTFLTIENPQPELSFGTSQPLDPQQVGREFKFPVTVSTAGQLVDGVDLRINFDPQHLQTISLEIDQSTPFSSYPALTFDNQRGTINISANIGSDNQADPVIGQNINIGWITMQPQTSTNQTEINYQFTLGERNDSNIVLHQAINTQDPIDILETVTSKSFAILPSVEPTPTVTLTPVPTEIPDQIPTPTPTSTPSPSPSPLPSPTTTPTPSPLPTNTPTPTTLPTVEPTSEPTPTTIAPTQTPTPTPEIINYSLLVRLQGRNRPNVNKSTSVTIKYKPLDRVVSAPFQLETDISGQVTFDILSGQYRFLIDAPGYLVKVIDELVINSSNSYLNLSNYPLIGGDFNDDGIINEVDYTLHFLPNFLQANNLVDLDASGQVNNLDYGIIRNNWNQTDDNL